jgi:hypothetical protein
MVVTGATEQKLAVVCVLSREIAVRFKIFRNFWMKFYHMKLLFLLLLLLLQGYKLQACFRLQENASSHLAMGRPIFRYPLGL